MLYFKHAEFAKKFHVSLRTVHNWIEAAIAGRLKLDLHSEDGKTYVANTARNIALISELSESRRKFRNTKASKVITPRPEFYSIYSERQIYDIAVNLEFNHEIPRQYSYFGVGADHWDKYTQKLVAEDTPNLINSTIRLLKSNQGYLDDLLARYKRVNVIDVGVGNAQPVKDFLEHLLERKELGRYIALDISAGMIEIARQNIKKWFGDRVAFEGRELDINYDRFSDLLISEYASKDAADTVNIVLLFGGTLSNMREPDAGYRIIHDSIGVRDILIHATKLDTEATRNYFERSYFDFNLFPGETRLAPIHGLVVDLLNIDKAFYTVEMGYDAARKQRFERIRLAVSLSITFNFKDGERTLELNKGDAILTWRGLQQTAEDVHRQFDRNDFYLLHSSQTDDREYILTASRIKCD